MGMHVDEAGAQDEARGVDGPLGAGSGGREGSGVGDGGNHRAVQQDVRRAAVRSGSVHQDGVADECLHRVPPRKTCG